MSQCKLPHPSSPSPNIFICVEEKTDEEHIHSTYDVNGRTYYWFGNVIFVDPAHKKPIVHRGL